MWNVKRNIVHGGLWDEARYIWKSRRGNLHWNCCCSKQLSLIWDSLKELVAGSAPFCVLMHFNLSFRKLVLCFYFSYQQRNVQDGLVGRDDQISFPEM